MSENKNHFNYNRLFPDINSILKRKGKTIDKLFDKALFVIDTNSLLMPYLTGKDDIEKIRKVYEKLSKKNRLYIPEHVFREFAKNRSLKISNLFTHIDNQLSGVPTIKSFEYPILGELDEYKKLKSARQDILDKLKDYKELLKELKGGITNWNWSDPVTIMYQETFSNKNLISTNASEEDLINEYNERIENDIPPGNKDKSKDINAIGDFVIWKSILELGKKEKKDIIFISNDEKNDWLLKGNKKSISTKFELVDEYYRYTEGYQFISITFSDFLEKQGLDIDLKDIYDQFEEIFGPGLLDAELNKREGSVLKDLKKIYEAITDFLTFNEDNPEEFTFIGTSINEYVDHFIKHYRKQYSDTKEWNVYFDYFFLFEEWLKEIKSLNDEIIYQEHRMKKDTRTEGIKLKALAKEFVSKYEEFQLM